MNTRILSPKKTHNVVAQRYTFSMFFTSDRHLFTGEQQFRWIAKVADGNRKTGTIVSRLISKQQVQFT